MKRICEGPLGKIGLPISDCQAVAASTIREGRFSGTIRD